MGNCHFSIRLIGKSSVVQILVKTELEQNLAIDIFLCEALLTWIMKTM